MLETSITSHTIYRCRGEWGFRGVIRHTEGCTREGVFIGSYWLFYKLWADSWKTPTMGVGGSCTREGGVPWIILE